PPAAAPSASTAPRILPLRRPAGRLERKDAAMSSTFVTLGAESVQSAGTESPGAVTPWSAALGDAALGEAAFPELAPGDAEGTDSIAAAGIESAGIDGIESAGIDGIE